MVIAYKLSVLILLLLTPFLHAFGIIGWISLPMLFSMIVSPLAFINGRLKYSKHDIFLVIMLLFNRGFMLSIVIFGCANSLHLLILFSLISRKIKNLGYISGIINFGVMFLGATIIPIFINMFDGFSLLFLTFFSMISVFFSFYSLNI